MVPGATIVNSIKENAGEIHAINPRTPERNRPEPTMSESGTIAGVWQYFPPYINCTVAQDCPLRFRRGGGESFSQNPKSLQSEGKRPYLEWVILLESTEKVSSFLIFMSSIYNQKRVFDYSYLISFHFFLNIINFVGRRSCQLIVNHYNKFVFKHV